MRHCPRLPFAFFGVVLWLCFLPVHGEAAHINVIELDNQIITPVTQKYIEGAVDRSEADGAVCLVIMLDTPGGLMESTRAIVKRIMNAEVPIVVYVAPSGSRAGSAGLFITLAAHIAAMAPSTNIGAAHPVAIGGMGDSVRKIVRRVRRIDKEASEKGEGEEGEAREEIVEEEQRSPMAEKIINDTVAWVTTIAKARGRNEEWAEKAVTESFSITEEEAVKKNVVDLIAEDLPDLFSQIDGRTVQIKGKAVALTTAGAAVVTIPMSPLQKFLATITHPNIAYLLMMLGTLGLIFEFTHPGIGFPGIAGVICWLLALYSFQILPVNYVAIALLLLGLGLLVAEVKVVSYGLLALGGAICLTLAGLMLFQSSDPMLRVSLSVILPTVITLAAITLLVLHRVVKSLGYPVTTGAQGLIGEVGEAATDLNLEGMIFVHGENWRARSRSPVNQGEKVRVTHVKGLSLEVEPEKSENIQKGEQ